MADVELVIKIPEEVYEHILKAKSVPDVLGIDMVNTINAVKNGTPLPKGHGRLIDAREYENIIRKHYFDNSTVIRCTEIALDNATPIIEADTESEDKDKG